MILLIDNYDSFTFNLVHHFGAMGVTCDVRRNDMLSVEDALACQPQAIVISPGPCTPDEAGICCRLIAEAARKKIPVLGVCLGHQAIGQVFGAKVVRAPTPMHGKISAILHENDGVFAGLPNPVDMVRYHSLTLAPETIPDCLHVNARTEDGVIMGIRHRDYPVHGVQFHPESIASSSGRQLLQNFLEISGCLPAESSGHIPQNLSPLLPGLKSDSPEKRNL